MLSFFSAAAGAVFIYMTAVFLVALFKRDNSIVDIAWGPGFILVGLAMFFLRPGFEARHILISVLVTAWGVRLATHIYLRNRAGERISGMLDGARTGGAGSSPGASSRFSCCRGSSC